MRRSIARPREVRHGREAAGWLDGDRVRRPDVRRRRLARAAAMAVASALAITMLPATSGCRRRKPPGEVEGSVATGGTETPASHATIAATKTAAATSLASAQPAATGGSARDPIGPRGDAIDAGAALDGGAPSARVDGGFATGVGADEHTEEVPNEAHPPVRVGGPWVRCYGNFRASGEPVKDVTRLSLLCGPENGMRRLSTKTLEGSVAEGAAPVTGAIQAKRGECYRVFAVAEPSVADLDVTVRSSRGATIASDHGEDAWPVVQPDRPFCALEDDTWAIEIGARRGKGRFAYEVWVLR